MTVYPTNFLAQSRSKARRINSTILAEKKGKHIVFIIIIAK